MSGGNSVEQHIDTVDAFARTLYLRARSSPSVADAVRQLHFALRHLRVEAADPDSPLSAASGAHSGHLRSLVDDCGAALKALDAALDDGRRAEQLAGRVRTLRERIDDFLDAVQLQSRARDVAPVNADQKALEDIKDKVDNVAKRVFSRRDSGFSEDDDGLWREFKAELEKEGFSPEVLRKHKEVVRAYIRELERMSSQNGGAPPSVRGLLEYEAETSSPKEMYPAIDNQKFAPSMKTARRMPGEGPPPPPPKEPKEPRHSVSELPASGHPLRQSFSSDDTTPSEHSDSLALISTKELVAMDGLNSGMANMNLVPMPHRQYSMSSSPETRRYLPQRVGSLPGPHDLAELPASPHAQIMGSPLPLTIPPAVSPFTAQQAQFPSGSPRMSGLRLAPDSHGNAIPMDAVWTKINRDRVSPEVLQRAGVRYEARPTYVAVFGRLSREQIEDYARQSADCRAARYIRQHSPPKAEFREPRERADSKSSRDEEDEDSELWDESDTTDYDDDKTSEKGKGHKSYYIVDPPEREKGSPSSTVAPKSILKNKNENHVRFDPEPYEVEGKSPRSLKDDREQRRRLRHRDDRHSEPRDRHDRYGDRERYGSERDRHSRRYDDRDRDHYHRRPHHRGDRSDRDRRSSKKKAWGETLGAVGIGGAAVSLLSVLAEAASSV